MGGRDHSCETCGRGGMNSDEPCRCGVKLPWTGDGFDLLYDGPTRFTRDGAAWDIIVRSHRTGRSRRYVARWTGNDKPERWTVHRA